MGGQGEQGCVSRPDKRLRNLLLTYKCSGLVQCPKCEMRQWYEVSDTEIHNIRVLGTGWCGYLVVCNIKCTIWTIKPKKYKLLWHCVAVSVWTTKEVRVQEGYKILAHRRGHLDHVDVCTLVVFLTLSVNMLYQVLS